MYTTLKIPTPKPDVALAHSLLRPLHTLSSQHAAIALRAWWDSNTEIDLAHHGLRVWRSHICSHNSDIDAEDLPVMLLDEAVAGEREIIVAIFADGSAVVLRSEFVPKNPDDPQERFQVLPIVLSLSTAFRPTDGRPDLSLRIHRNRRPSAKPIITLSSGNQEDGWVNLEAGWTTIEHGIDYELRQSVRADILACARAWCAEIDRLPVLHFPEQGPGYPAEAALGEMLSLDLNLDPKENWPYACPAFLPFITFSNKATEDYKKFVHEIAMWMITATPARIEAVHLSVLSARMSQTSKPTKPGISAQAVLKGSNNPDPEWSKRLSAVFTRIAQGKEAPIPYKQLVGQRVTRIPGRLVSSFITDYDMAFAHVARSDLKLSNHEKMSLSRRFAKFAEFIT